MLNPGFHCWTWTWSYNSLTYLSVAFIHFLACYIIVLRSGFKLVSGFYCWSKNSVTYFSLALHKFLRHLFTCIVVLVLDSNFNFGLHWWVRILLHIFLKHYNFTSLHFSYFILHCNTVFSVQTQLPWTIIFLIYHLTDW